ncbi:putative E3 ubiquitin ligase complex SCF subunit sconB [Hypsizygus marmoreus]|uniref:E3 ubiquitin ligase complex SCF subunit sconB n=1 Tax=Hypsizygus marmoreus TaxID=39966 RepID=A0A369JQ93_HYPMA|nr:putative E3 ubiquitin ligase complex SCF subunit sconB [Hypsizygus marmoreus]
MSNPLNSAIYRAASRLPSFHSTLMSAASPPSSYVCDTLPAPRLASDHPEITTDTQQPPVRQEPPVVLDDADNITSSAKAEEQEPVSSPPPEHAAPRKLCVRHQRMADEGTNLKLQQSLDAMPLEEREAVNAVWSNFSSSSHPRRALILQGLLTMCCFSQLSLLTEQLAQLIRIDPFACLPREVSLKILGYLDATSLCRAAQVTRRWKSLADDDILWRGICEQHIGQKCHKCGWGLPILEKKRAFRPHSPTPSDSTPACLLPPMSSLKRSIPDDDNTNLVSPPLKRQRSSSSDVSSVPSASSSFLTLPLETEPSSCALLAPNPPLPMTESITRPWKDVYSERMTIERNWRRGRCTVRTLKGHTDGVMCLQFSETLAYPAFPVLITGSYDRTVRVWNMETGVELHCLKGHTRAVRALQFDDIKLITGSMDHTLKVWDWRRGKCIRTLTGHTDGVVCLNFDSNVLASGSVDSTIKVWNLRTGGAFTLRGHSDWVNAVQLWDSNPAARSASTSASLFDVPSGSMSPSTPGSLANEIDVGKMLFSASDDGTIKLWDLTLRTCIRTMTGHVGQVQSMKLLTASECSDDEPPVGGDTDMESSGDESGPSAAHQASSSTFNASGSTFPAPAAAQSSSAMATSAAKPFSSSAISQTPFVSGKKPVLISGSLDNTIKLWDIETGKTIRTLFGHIEGVWAVASDKLRLVSGSHDRTIKVWSRDEGKCTATLVGHQAAVSCLALGEDKIVSGSDDANIKIWSFSG